MSSNIPLNLKIKIPPLLSTGKICLNFPNQCIENNNERFYSNLFNNNSTLLSQSSSLSNNNNNNNIEEKKLQSYDNENKYNNLNIDNITQYEKFIDGNETLNNKNLKNKKFIKWYARISCIISLMPMILFHKHTKTMAVLHLILSPITSYFLQDFSSSRCDSDNLNIISRLLCGSSVTLANFAAVLMLMDETNKMSHYILSASICLGSLQLLIVLRKENVIRVMICTAIAVMVVTLAAIAICVPITTGKRFYQSVGLPLALLFLESSRH